MNNISRRYYRHNNKKFKYYCHNGKPFFYHEKHKQFKKDNENSNILLVDNKEDIKLEPVNERINQEDNKEKLEFMVNEKQEEIVLPKLPVIKMALGIIILVAVVFSISYAYFNYYYEDTRQADITMGEVYVRIPENTANITLTKIYPRTNTEARARDDNYVDFTVNAKNTSPNKVLSYTLNIADGTDVANKARISRDYIKVDLQERINGVYTYVQEGVSLNNFTFSGTVPVNTTSEIAKQYRLRIWVSDSVLISDTESGASYTQSEFASLYANYHISVNAVDRTYTPPAAQQIAALLTETNAAGNKIYTGANVANYVTFNGESWRIIGVYDGKLKIVKATPLEDVQKWQNSTEEGNTWNGSLLETYLNTTYYSNLSQTAKEMIAEGSWDVGTCGYGIAASAAYTCAHGTTLTGQDTNSNMVKVGLIATYEYLYAAENTCWATNGYDYDGGCKNQDWLFPTLTTYNNTNSHAWTLSPDSGYASRALSVGSDGYVANAFVANPYAASPVVYLKSDVTISGGDGQSEQTAYTLSYTAS